MFLSSHGDVYTIDRNKEETPMGGTVETLQAMMTAANKVQTGTDARSSNFSE